MATSTPGNKKRSASQNLSEKDTKKLKLNNSTRAAEETTLSGETQGRDIYDEITKRNSEQSPLLRLPAELRIKIYQYALGHYMLTPVVLLTQSCYSYYNKSYTKSYTIHCGVGPADSARWSWEFEEDLWVLARSLSMSSRQLHAEIGETLFTESPMRYNPDWEEVFPNLSKERKDAIRIIIIPVGPYRGRSRTPVPVLCDLFRMIDSLSNVKTVFVENFNTKLHLHVEEQLMTETQKRGLTLIYDRL